MTSGSCAPDMCPSCGSDDWPPLPSSGSRRVGSPPSSVLRATPTPAFPSGWLLMVAWPYPLSAWCLLPVPSGTTAPDRELSGQAAPCLIHCLSGEKGGPPRFLGNPCVDMPCSSTPAALPCQAMRQGHVAFHLLKDVGDHEDQHFEAQ